MAIPAQTRQESTATACLQTSKNSGIELSLSRRKLLKTSAVIGAGYWIVPSLQAAESGKEPGPNDQIRVASIGIGGKGQSDARFAAQCGRTVAICDIDQKRLAGAKNDSFFQDAAVYTDYRKMFDEMADQFDAVTISTPDHNHAAPALMAMRLGKHVYCQKPLTRTIYESRLVGEVARQSGVATQMGNQGSADESLRRQAALLKAGVLGKVSEVHVWTNRPIWPQGGKSQPACECPDYIAWDEWIGPAKFRPYAKGYHPFVWRGYWDYGTGALGDIACHALNMAFAGLDLRNPISVVAETSGHDREMFPGWSKITFEFPATEKRDAVKFFWYDGGMLPDPERFPKVPFDKLGGCLIVDEKGQPMPLEAEGVQVEFEKAPRPDELGHFQEWFASMQSGKPAFSNFADHAGPLTETVLLGNLAVWAATQEGAAGAKVEWDAQNLKANLPGVEELIKPIYRTGWTLDV